ncbi:hypothetical protein LTR56_017971 [Elasticomyces elasticus]|nr:hypothetical protein LTR56_017971 [Elasticomyces elasticus]KAK3637172.1 hypothetical protein LTR22_018362 [Elasticomyces elasticus]KAK4914245.1 hypothetical protein LTR49_017488 [Elasticomyces elasticus]KAK5749663.1 hypothetical protein LTS12_020301 [Elasticomyces elasticus]
MATLPHRAIAPPRPTTRSEIIPPKRQKQSRPTEIWSNLLRRTREAQARNRSHSIQHRELIICGGSPADQHSFVQSLARPPPPAPPTRNRDAQRQQKVRGEVKLSNRFAYGYGHVSLYTPPEQQGGGLQGLLGGESEEAVRLDVHTVPEAEEGYERTLRRLLEVKKGKDEGTDRDVDDGFAGGDDVKVEEGRRPAVALLLSWKEPWKFLALLKRWLQLLASALLPAGAAPEDPLEVLKEHKIALTVVVQHVEAQEALEREDYREETFDYISQCLRTCLLPISAALIYTSASPPPQQPGSALSEIQKVLYASLSLDLAPLSPAPAKGTTTTNRAELAPKHCLVDRMAILIPSNWDSAGKIRLLSETFTPETVLEAWVADLNIPLHQPPHPPAQNSDPSNSETKGEHPTQATPGASRPSSRETEQIFASTSDAGEEDPSLTARTLSPPRNPVSAITTYETAILDPNAHKTPQPPKIEVTTKPDQLFLGEMRGHLLHLEAEDAKAAAKLGEGGRDRVATTGSAVGGKSGVGVPGGEQTGALGGLGDVQFNVGGVSYNAEAAIERLRKGESPGPGGGAGREGGYGGLASSSPRTTTPRPPRREDREVSATTPLAGRGEREVSTGSARGGGGGKGMDGDLPVDDLKEYFRSLAKRSGGGGTDGGSGSSTPSRGPSGKT